MAKSVQDQIRAILEEYGQEVQEVVNKAAIETAKETAKDLKQTSPKSKRAGKHYANNWAMKEKKIPAGGINTVVYNKAPTYRLTHLLEKGHVVKNQYGTYGRAPAIRHIEPAEERGVENFLRKVESEL